MVHVPRAQGIRFAALALTGCLVMAALAQPCAGQDALEDLVARATTIVWGQVSGTESRWQSDERGRQIYTTVAISPVFASVKGQVQGPLSFEVVGGTVEGIT